MKSITKRSIAFSATCAISAFVGWAIGYDFNERTPLVDFWILVTLAIALIVAASPIFADRRDASW